MIRSFLFSLAAGGLALSSTLLTYVSAPTEAIAQEATETPASDETGGLADGCFAVYPFGQLAMNLTEPTSGAAVAPGDTLMIAGTLRNDTHAELPDGKVYVRVLRDEAAVAPQHWHPVVAEFEVPGVSVPAATTTASETTFSTTWHVPAFAPAGAYRVEASYLAADGSPILGVPYVPNVFGATSSFTVSDAGSAAAVAWERGRVLFNEAPFVFRAVPPRPQPGPLTIVAPLAVGGANDVSVNVEKSLYSWTDVEGDTLVTSDFEPWLISPSASEPVSFTWDAPTPGVYELVLKAVPVDENILPSVLHVRFYYEGTVPRILHTGMRAEEDGSGTVAACFFNSTFGPEGGSGTFRIESEGATVQEVALADLAGEKLSLLPISADVVKAGFVLVAEAKGLDGAVTDTERVTFPGEPAIEEPAAFAWPHLPGVPTRWYWIGGGVVVVGLLLLIAYNRQHRMYTEPKEPLPPG